MDEDYSRVTESEGSVRAEVLSQANSQVLSPPLPSNDDKCSTKKLISFQKIEGRLRILHIGATTRSQRGVAEGQTLGVVQRPLSRREHHMEAEPPPCYDLQESCSRIHSLFAEVIQELEEHIQGCSSLEKFPQLEDYSRKRTYRKGKGLACRLCRQELAGNIRWHFESLHYDNFLDWLDRKARKDVLRRKTRLIQHLRQRQNPN